VIEELINGKMIASILVNEMPGFHIDKFLQKKVLGSMLDFQYQTAFTWEVCQKYNAHVSGLLRIWTSRSDLTPSKELAELFYDAGLNAWLYDSDRQQLRTYSLKFFETAYAMINSIGFSTVPKLRKDIRNMVRTLKAAT
jgi:hypothetical protein